MTDEPTVLHVLEALEGGTARHLIDIVRHVPATHHVAIPTRRVGGLTDHAAAPAIAAADAVIHRVEMRRSPLTVANARSLLELRALVHRIRPDVVHGHSSVGGALARLASGSTPCLYTPNGIATSRFATTVERWLGRRTERLVAVSASEGASVARRRLIAADRIIVVPNGIELEAPPAGPDVRELLGIPPDALLVGSISRLVDQKAPGRLAEVATLLLDADSAVHVIVIGDGPLRSSLAPCAPHPRFHHVPALEHAERVVGQFDVFVLTSRFEGFPYSPLEAMRAGTPPVLTNVVGSTDVVRQAVDGILVQEGDQDAMATHVLALLADPERRHAMSVAAREGVSRFDVASMAAGLSAIYEDVRSAS